MLSLTLKALAVIVAFAFIGACEPPADPEFEEPPVEDEWEMPEDETIPEDEAW